MLARRAMSDLGTGYLSLRLGGPLGNVEPWNMRATAERGGPSTLIRTIPGGWVSDGIAPVTTDAPDLCEKSGCFQKRADACLQPPRVTFALEAREGRQERACEREGQRGKDISLRESADRVGCGECGKARRRAQLTQP